MFLRPVEFPTLLTHSIVDRIIWKAHSLTIPNSQYVYYIITGHHASHVQHWMMIALVNFLHHGSGIISVGMLLKRSRCCHRGISLGSATFSTNLAPIQNGQVVLCCCSWQQYNCCFVLNEYSLSRAWHVWSWERIKALIQVLNSVCIFKEAGESQWPWWSYVNANLKPGSSQSRVKHVFISHLKFK